MGNQFLDNNMIKEATQSGLTVDELMKKKQAQDAAAGVPDFGAKMAALGNIGGLDGAMGIPYRPPSEILAPEAPVNQLKMKAKPDMAAAPQSEPELSLDDTPEPVVKDPSLRALLMEKLKTDFSDDSFKKQKAEMMKRQNQLAGAQLAAGIGDALARKGSGETDKFFDQQKKNIEEQTVGALEKRKAEMIKGADVEAKLKPMDPDSEESKAFRKMMETQFPAVAKSYGDDWGKVSAADQDTIFKPLQLRENIEMRKEQARILSQQRQDDKDTKREEKLEGLKTPFGYANTIDDAKQLKEAHESKQKFDSQLQEMIDLREKHGGGALLDREDVARGKQLSKDLLLEYKNLKKLGVLSAADEKIINAIIPADPLEYNSPLAAAQGQDPILHQMKAFKQDAEKDFNTRVQTRIKDGGASVKPMAQFPKTVKKGNKIATVSNAAELKEALDEGFGE